MKTLILLISMLLVLCFIPSCDQDNHYPEIADQVFYLDENSEAGTIVGMIEAHDLDEEGALSFKIIEGNTDNAFTLDKNSGILLVNNSTVLDFEKIERINLKVLISDNHPNKPLESTASITVILNNLNEFAPAIEEQTFSVNERSPLGTIVGNIVATDPDSGQSLTFKIESGNENQVIHLDSVTGELFVEDSAWFNHSINQELVCMVSVSDNDPDNPLTSYAQIIIEVIDVPLVTIDLTGYVQKGPFILGSPITITELGPDLTPTGRNYTTQVIDNSGKYDLPNVELESQYLLLKADGYYFNERTGKLSESQLTLFNLVDITDQESFNINVISHLEKERIIELMNGGIEFSEAKRQAKNEILDIFGFKTIDQLQSEQMDISTTGEDNAMLLATSLILQGDRTTGEFSEILSQISLDFKEDGTMGNESIGTELINGINYANLSNIRQYIEQRYNGLDIDYEIPEFEKYVNQFISQTTFVSTNQFNFPGQGTYGTNVLPYNLTEVEHKYVSDRVYSLAVEVPEGRSLMVKVIGDGVHVAGGTEINMDVYRVIEPIRYTTFTTTSSGLCDVYLYFIQNPESPTLTMEYFEDKNTTPSFTKLVEIVSDYVPVDSTLLK